MQIGRRTWLAALPALLTLLLWSAYRPSPWSLRMLGAGRGPWAYSAWGIPPTDTDKPEPTLLWLACEYAEPTELRRSAKGSMLAPEGFGWYE
jgi:hypothetical protein